MIDRKRLNWMMPGAAALLLSPMLFGATADASTTRTSGSGQSVYVSWTEYDPDDLLRIPGNVHVGFLYADSGPYGNYANGNVTDFDCDEGETPWGGGGHGVSVDIVDAGGDAVSGAVQDAVDAVVDSGASIIVADAVVDAVQADLSSDVPDEIVEAFEEFPGCDYIQDRFLDGTDTVKMTVDKKGTVARIAGTLTVSSGGHGDPGDVLGRPPVDITITGGDWEKFEWSSKNRGATYSYSNWQKGTSYNGGKVSGGIGAMGFADDADDESYAGFSSFRYKTVEKVR